MINFTGASTPAEEGVYLKVRQSRNRYQGRCSAIGNKKCQGLLGPHTFSGADWGAKLVGISKKRWILSYLTHDPNSDVFAAFTNFGDLSLDMP